MYHIITGGTALPIALYLRISDTLSKLKLSGNDCILAVSSGVNLLNRLPISSTGSVEFRLTFARWKLIVLQGLLRS